jgi:hypothetical protein
MKEEKKLLFSNDAKISQKLFLSSHLTERQEYAITLFKEPYNLSISSHEFVMKSISTNTNSWNDHRSSSE